MTGVWEAVSRRIDRGVHVPAGVRTFSTIESHTAGNPTRTALSGVPELSGATMLELMHELAAEHDWVRTALMFEPRGGSVMSGCVLQPPCDPRADIGVLYIEASGHLPICGHDTIGLVTVLIDTGLVDAVEPVTQLVLDTPAGLVGTEAQIRDGRVESVAFVSTPSFLPAGGLPVELPDGTRLTVDLAWGRNFYAIVPAAQVGIDLDSPFAGPRIAMAALIRDAVDAAYDVTHQCFRACAAAPTSCSPVSRAIHGPPVDAARGATSASWFSPSRARCSDSRVRGCSRSHPSRARSQSRRA